MLFLVLTKEWVLCFVPGNLLEYFKLKRGIFVGMGLLPFNLQKIGLLLTQSESTEIPLPRRSIRLAQNMCSTPEKDRDKLTDKYVSYFNIVVYPNSL